MKYNNVEFDTYFKNYPDQNGFFGKYGGSYIPPELQVAMNEIAEAYHMLLHPRASRVQVKGGKEVVV